MRYLTVIFLLACSAAIAEDQPYSVSVGCDGDGIAVQVAMAKPGIVYFVIPHGACGQDI
jgi:hypothetical protein